MRLVLLLCLSLIGLPSSALDGEVSDLGVRVERLAGQLRCPASINQTLAESEAAIAFELKGLIAQKLREGQQEEQIVQYLVERYGQQIRYQPGLDGATAPLWLIPMLLVALLMMMLIWPRRLRRPPGLGE
ncbi:cytochrome c-type biogenesis protein CcmH [Ferrimonas sediminicola]|uniref:Cytochrome c-type biogenesis protein n=1 Tax=Ferrimonas sediminicola TaxID=2569538 RepID=A0A4U1BEH9_9GAMM|nr:cytochrome c-type biogenesis protein CcmH [Ferrimonas sediminicola]TKB48734.1 cytochrome c-type biogenesis protein CcmH [Ferrimonas sediminicola]